MDRRRGFRRLRADRMEVSAMRLLSAPQTQVQMSRDGKTPRALWWRGQRLCVLAVEARRRELDGAGERLRIRTSIGVMELAWDRRRGWRVIAVPWWLCLPSWLATPALNVPRFRLPPQARRPSFPSTATISSSVSVRPNREEALPGWAWIRRAALDVAAGLRAFAEGRLPGGRGPYPHPVGRS